MNTHKGIFNIFNNTNTSMNQEVKMLI